ncbi:MAG: AMP-binding protein [Cryobacterium sp.]
MKNLRVVSADDPIAFLAELRLALTAGGEALLPRSGPAGPGGELIARVPITTAVVIETSGSTGTPKRVQLSRSALLSSAAASASMLGGPGQWLLALPAHYVAGVQVLVRSIAAETTPICMPPAHFDPLVFAQYADRLTEPLRYTSLVPVQLARLLDASARDPHVADVLRRFTAILVGGQAVSPALVSRAHAAGVNLVRTYGSSETAGGCVYNGMPIGTTRVRAVDGLLQISGPVLADGYLGDPERTDEHFSVDAGVRWFHTGDLGTVDENGLVTVTGRADNVIISGGEKISLDAAQAVVRRQPGFETAVVVGADHPEWGRVPVVVLAGDDPSRGAGEDRRELLSQLGDAVARELGRAGRPARILVVAEIPLLASGKPDLQALAGLATGAHTPELGGTP